MTPSLHPGDRVLLLRIWPKILLLKDRIVVITPEKTKPVSWADAGKLLFGGDAYIKRVTALSGEIQVSDELRYAIWQEKLQSSHRIRVTTDSELFWNIPEGYCFVISDNRKSKSDSRYWGPIPISSILGVVIFKFSKRAKYD